MNKNKQSNHWSNYWQNGQLTSLPQDYKYNYDGTIHNQWLESFKALKTKSSVLDLCTGNCAIALLASQFSNKNNKDLAIVAVDAASIDKKIIARNNINQKQYLENIKLIANTYVEDIDLPRDHFDLITSQYGIEYTNWQKSAEKIEQLLKPNGKFVMISHCPSSQIIETMEKEKEDYLKAINNGLFRNYQRFAEGKLSFRNFQTQTKRIQKILNTHFNQQPSDLLRSLLMLNDSIINTSKAELKIKHLELKAISQQHKNAYKRLLDLLRVNSKLQENPTWFSCFEKEGLKLEAHKQLFHNTTVHCGDLYIFKK